jgi:hypothetical protein
MPTTNETLALEKAPKDENTEIVPWSDAHVFDPREVKERVDAIHRIMSKMMQKDVHYGVIPGTKKPTLYKPGSEILLLTFRIAIEPEITDLSTSDEIRYRIRAFGRHVPTSAFVGAGVGECSSNEEKFLWRAALSKEEFAGTPEDQKRYKYKKEWDRGRSMIVKVEQIKVPPADAANAVLKRAKKRAQVDFCLTAMAASDIFTQDVEDLPDGYLNDDSASSSTEPRVSAAQLAELQKGLATFKDAAKATQRLCKVFKVDKLEELPAKEFESAKAKIALAEKSPKTETLVTAELPAGQYQACLKELQEQRRG